MGGCVAAFCGAVPSWWQLPLLDGLGVPGTCMTRADEGQMEKTRLWETPGPKQQLWGRQSPVETRRGPGRRQGHGRFRQQWRAGAASWERAVCEAPSRGANRVFHAQYCSDQKASARWRGAGRAAVPQRPQPGRCAQPAWWGSWVSPCRLLDLDAFLNPSSASAFLTRNGDN